MSIYQDDTVKNLKIISGSTDITNKVKSGSFKCDNLLCDDQIAFGSCSSARAQFVTTEDLELTGNKITVQYGSGSTWTNLGVYKVTYSSTIENSEEVNITMYDALKNFDVDVAGWYNALEFPLTLQSMRASLAQHIGVQQSNATLVNDGIYITRTINPSKLNGMDVLRYIGELNGVFPHATSDGKLEWLSLGTTATTITASVIQGANGVSQKTYSTSPISKLCIRSEDGDIGVTVGTGANAYYVTANVLVYGMTSTQLNTVATNLYNKIAGITYTPTKLSMKCDPTIKMGALLQYGDTSFYLLSRKTSGLLFDEIECDGNQYLEEDNSIETSVEQLRGKSNVLTRDIESTTSRVENIEDDYTTHTEFTQQAESFNLQIEKLQAQIDGSVELYTVNYVPTRENYPAWDWTGMYCDGTYTASDDLHFLYPTSELQRHLRTMAYNEDSGLTYRFTKIDNEYVWQEVADTETAVILSRLTAVEATTEGLTVSVSEVTADLADNYLTTTETRNEIQAKADAIELSVAGTYATQETTKNISASVNLKLNKTDLVSEFNAKANVITLTSDNFKLSANGDLWAQNVDIAGKLTAENGGNIGGWTVSKNTNLYADGAGYRAYLQKPTDANTWVFSTQIQNGSGEYFSQWYVTANGYEKTRRISVVESAEIGGSLSANSAVVNSITCGLFTTQAARIDIQKPLKITASDYSYITNKLTVGGSGAYSSYTFCVDGNSIMNGNLFVDSIITQKMHGLTYYCAGSNKDVVFYWNNNKFQVYIDNTYVGSLTPA